MTASYVFSPETLIKAYSLGVFPMAESKDDPEIHFFEPDKRGILPIMPPHIPRRLLRLVKQRPYQVTYNRDFPAVIASCAETTPDRDDSWINPEIQRLYVALHAMGFAHSVEVWEDNRLIGGLYGVAIGGAFFGESMFSRVSNASKITLCHLMARLKYGNFSLLDAQFVSDHLIQFGIESIDNTAFQKKLKTAINTEASLELDTPESQIIHSLWHDNKVTS